MCSCSAQFQCLIMFLLVSMVTYNHQLYFIQFILISDIYSIFSSVFRLSLFFLVYPVFIIYLSIHPSNLCIHLFLYLNVPYCCLAFGPHVSFSKERKEKGNDNTKRVFSRSLQRQTDPDSVGLLHCHHSQEPVPLSHCETFVSFNYSDQWQQ